MKLQCQVGLALEFHPYGTGVPMGVGTRVSPIWHSMRPKRIPLHCSLHKPTLHLNVYTYNELLLSQILITT